MTLLRRVLKIVVTIVRWWWGVGWLVLGVIGVVWGVFAIRRGDGGAYYLIIGGLTSVLFAWFIHPWGLQRHSAKYSAARRAERQRCAQSSADTRA